MQIQPEYLIESSEVEVKLKKNYLKIFNLLPGPAKTFVFLGLVRVGSFVIAHVDQHGTILYQHKFEKEVDSIALVSECEVLALEPRLNQLLLLNLTNHHSSTIPFQFTNQQSDQSFMLTFSKSKYICVVEKGRYNDNRFKLSYFKSPLQKDSIPFKVYESDESWSYPYVVRKGNEESMVLWFKPRNDTEIQLKLHQIQADQSKFSVLKINNEIGVGYGQSPSLQLAISNVWEMQPNKYMLVCNTQKTTLGYKNKEGVVNNNFVWDTAKSQLRQTKFWFEQKYNDFLIDIHSFGQFAVFRTYYFQNGVAESSPCYYLHNPTEKIVTTDYWRCTYKAKVEYPMDQNTIVQGQYQNANVGSFKIRVKKLKKALK